MHFGYVALLGPPNAGKSTLLNQILGQKVSIVTPKPQTTRNRISGILSDEHGQIVFLDTPGVHAARGTLNRFLVEAAWQALSASDMAVTLLDVSKMVHNPDAIAENNRLLSKVADAGLPMVLALNKVDMVSDKALLLPVMENAAQIMPDVEIYPISALTGNGVDKLLQAVWQRLPEGSPMYDEDQISTAPLRFLAAEIIREKLFLELRQELPYQTAVAIEEFDESDPKRAYINAVIHVAKSNHKGIVIGKGGATLKKIGTESRQEIAELIGMPVHLELWVRVSPRWTDNPRAVLELLGESDLEMSMDS
ncbi:GTPase Era [Desulfovibrio inopinatus]|uniref:GTPase Era n=1 Tax=Desulfovibrio inopinatus TaxID=102109 RepID=UPI000420D891|nr:GTPase Era [Desulfovibrio inopinatus]